MGFRETPPFRPSSSSTASSQGQDPGGTGGLRSGTDPRGLPVTILPASSSSSGRPPPPQSEHDGKDVTSRGVKRKAEEEPSLAPVNLPKERKAQEPRPASSSSSSSSFSTLQAQGPTLQAAQAEVLQLSAGAKLGTHDALVRVLKSIAAGFRERELAAIELLGRSLAEHFGGAGAGAAGRRPVIEAVREVVREGEELDAANARPWSAFLRGVMRGFVSAAGSEDALAMTREWIDAVWAGSVEPVTDDAHPMSGSLALFRAVLGALPQPLSADSLRLILDRTMRYLPTDADDARAQADETDYAVMFLQVHHLAGDRVATVHQWVHEAAQRVTPSAFAAMFGRSFRLGKDSFFELPTVGDTESLAILLAPGTGALRAGLGAVASELNGDNDLFKGDVLGHRDSAFGNGGTFARCVDGWFRRFERQPERGEHAVGAMLALREHMQSHLELARDRDDVDMEGNGAEIAAEHQRVPNLERNIAYLDGAVLKAVSSFAPYATRDGLVGIGQRYAGIHEQARASAARLDALLDRLYPPLDSGATKRETKERIEQRGERAEVRRWLRTGMSLGALDASAVAGIPGLSQEERVRLFALGDWSHPASPQELCTRIRKVADAAGCAPALRAELIAVLVDNGAAHLGVRALCMARAAIVEQLPYIGARSDEVLKPGAAEGKARPGKTETSSLKHEQGFDDILRKPLILGPLMSVYATYARTCGMQRVFERQPLAVFAWEIDAANEYCCVVAGEVAALQRSPQVERVTVGQREHLQEQVARLGTAWEQRRQQQLAGSTASSSSVTTQAGAEEIEGLD